MVDFGTFFRFFTSTTSLFLSKLDKANGERGALVVDCLILFIFGSNWTGDLTTGVCFDGVVVRKSYLFGVLIRSFAKYSLGCLVEE